VDASRLSDLLQPYLSHPLALGQYDQLRAYLDLLLKWNAKTNLTAVREPEQIVTRHFGESLFAAERLLDNEAARSVIDVGSGAGFPGLPVAIYAPQAQVTLIESQNRKATFLKEAVRAARLSNVTVFAGRAEDYAGTAELVTMRAVEKFESSATTAARLVAPSGRLALLIGAEQVKTAVELLPELHFADPLAIPGSKTRCLLTGRR
jgi:16S rRNA (guanine527-N7)-methyltransferase